jgi:DNA-binding transcriptional MerR regulator
MLEAKNNDELPAIPGKRYFTIGEVAELCGVKPHVLRYWEQEFPQLKPVKRRGNRRYYQRQDVIVIRQIRGLLYEQGFTIGGARNKLTGEEARLLAAISLGAVFLGAMTYIGNGPNFMVKAIAEQSGVKMPSFFGYVVYSLGVLLPVFVLVSVLFL